MKIYDDYEYANNRLSQTVVRYDGKAVMIEVINGVGMVSGRFISTGQYLEQPLKKFNIDPVPLGYVNQENSSTYVVRIPMREDWRQGLRYNNMRDWKGRNVSHLDWTNIGKTIENVFPSLHDAKTYVDKNGGEVAFHRDFSLQHDGMVAYKAKFIIGKLNNNEIITIEPKFEYLREVFEQEIGIGYSF